VKFLIILAISTGLLTASQAMEKPSFHTKGTPTGKPTGQLRPGEYWWKPQLSPSGPVVVLVSIPQQTMHVYHNGILIGRSTVSTGAKGRSTLRCLDIEDNNFATKNDELMPEVA
jgi:hypothetical protein